jgi:hypothetical protein
MKALSFWLIITLPLAIYSQEYRTLISGTVHSDSTRVENAHVINKTSQKGSITNKLGEFKISARAGDTLIVSDIQFQGKIIVLSEQQIEQDNLDIHLEVVNNELEEVVLRNYGNMAEELGLPNAGKKPLTKVERNLNAYSQKSTPMVILQALLFKPGGIDDIYNIISGNRKRDRKLKQLMDEDLRQERNNSIGAQIRAYLKDDFFVKEAKIPEELIDPYIQYCMPKGLPRLYREQRLIEVIDILLKTREEFLQWNGEDFPE